MSGVEALGLDDFTPLVGEQFRASLSSTIPVTLELVAVEQLPADDGIDAAFAVVFRGPADPALGQGTVSVEHDALGDLDLFVVPVSEETGGRFYEAVFTRLAG